jgi:hypothetical protein
MFCCKPSACVVVINWLMSRFNPPPLILPHRGDDGGRNIYKILVLPPSYGLIRGRAGERENKKIPAGLLRDAAGVGVF